MKALHVWERIFHYFKLWLFILAVVVIALGLFSSSALLSFDGEAIDYSVVEEAVDLSGADAVAYAFVTFAGGLAAFSLYLIVGAGFFWMLEHIFKKVQVIKSRGCQCACCKEEEGDAQVEKIMKWKDFYNEGIITEREFIQKRNEILGLHK